MQLSACPTAAHGATDVVWHMSCSSEMRGRAWFNHIQSRWRPALITGLHIKKAQCLNDARTPRSPPVTGVCIFKDFFSLKDWFLPKAFEDLEWFIHVCLPCSAKHVIFPLWQLYAGSNNQVNYTPTERQRAQQHGSAGGPDKAPSLHQYSIFQQDDLEIHVKYIYINVLIDSPLHVYSDQAQHVQKPTSSLALAFLTEQSRAEPPHPPHHTRNHMLLGDFCCPLSLDRIRIFFLLNGASLPPPQKITFHITGWRPIERKAGVLWHHEVQPPG